MYGMKNIAIVIVALIVVLAVASMFISWQAAQVIDQSGTQVPLTEESTAHTQETAYGFSYEYEPDTDGYTVVTPENATRGDLVFTQSVFDTTDYEDLQQGEVPREAPASLTIEVYRNPANQETREWITQHDESNYHLSPDGTISSVTKNSTEFLTYQYDGLYRADAYVTGKNGYIYVFANMWDNPQSAMKTDMEELLETVQWSTPQVPAQAAHGDIMVFSPAYNAHIGSPLKVEGTARGFWYFEGSFPLMLVDANGDTVGEGIATAQGEWMTEDFVPFSGEVTFSAPVSGEGTLILRKDNPSGMPENDDSIEISVRFE